MLLGRFWRVVTERTRLVTAPSSNKSHVPPAHAEDRSEMAGRTGRRAGGRGRSSIQSGPSGRVTSTRSRRAACAALARSRASRNRRLHSNGWKLTTSCARCELKLAGVGTARPAGKLNPEQCLRGVCALPNTSGTSRGAKSDALCWLKTAFPLVSHDIRALCERAARFVARTGAGARTVCTFQGLGCSTKRPNTSCIRRSGPFACASGRNLRRDLPVSRTSA